LVYSKRSKIEKDTIVNIDHIDAN